MPCEGGALMFLRAEEPHPPAIKCEVLFAMYTPDLEAFRENPIANGIDGISDHISRIHAQRLALDH